MRRKLEPRVLDRRADAVATFTDSGIWQADHREVRKAERHVDLDLHRIGVHAEDRGTSEAGEHAPVDASGHAMAGGG